VGTAGRRSLRCLPGAPSRRLSLDRSCVRICGLAPADSFLPPVRRSRAAGYVCPPDQCEASDLGRAYGRDDIVNGRAGCGGVGFIVDERLVGGGLGDTILHGMMAGFGQPSISVIV